MNQPLLWTLQVAILATGIYLFLRFLRTTRGGGLLRGLLVTLVIGVIGLWGLAKYLNLVELIHIIESFTPYVAVILTIIFQPELRRAMARLGQQNRLAQLFSSRRHETVAEVAAAATAMAARRHGALIAFQRETPLDAWTQNAAHIDAEAGRHLLESIFHPGSALHDGAVVIDGDRVVAAACLFPLTENIEISKSTGTRHRAALGLTEETDAVTLAVSEETGAISISDQGRMERDIPPAELEPALRRHLGLPAPGEGGRAGDGKGGVRRFRASTKAVFTQDLVRKGSAILMAAGMIYLAHQNLIVDDQLQSMTVRVLRPGAQATPQGRFLDIRLPEESFHLVSPKQWGLVAVKVSGTQAQIDRVDGVGCVINVPTDSPEGKVTVTPQMVEWVHGVSDLKVEWNPPLVLEIERFGRLSRDLVPECVPVDSSNLDPHFQAELVFARTSIELRGPQADLDDIEAGTTPFQLGSIVVAPTDRADKRVQLGLAPEFVSKNVSIVGGDTVGVTLEIKPAPHELGQIKMDVAVVNMSPSSAVNAAEWSVAQDDQVTFNLTSAGLFDSAPGTDAFTEQYNLIRTYVTDNMDVYVDVSEVEEESGNSVKVHYEFPRGWKKKLFAGREDEVPSARLEVELVSEDTILLKKR